MNAWDGDGVVDAELARTLVERTGLPVDDCTLFGEGWDNVAFLVNDEWVFRFPRREVAAELLQLELAVLPRLHGHLSIPTPLPTWVGESSADFERPYYGYALLRGTTLCRAERSDVSRRALAPAVGAFLRELHDLAPSLVRPVPLDEHDRTDPDRRRARIAERLAEVRSHGFDVSTSFDELADELHARYVPGRRHCWVHGDLYARHLLVHDVSVTAVIDWGDVHVGDLALDLSVAWSTFDQQGRAALFAAYGGVETDVVVRAQFKALHYAVTFLAYGHSISDDALIAEAHGALRRIESSRVGST